jgi:uncharacterized membrane protein
MESKAKFLGHPIHPMLIVFPLGLLATAVVFDAIDFIRGTTDFSNVSFWMIVAGVVGGLAAAIFGLVDWLNIPGGTRARRIGALHGVGNVIVTALFAVSAYLRWDDPHTLTMTAFVIQLIAAVIALVTGWLGGELVDRLGIGVDPGAHPDAPSSLSGRPASERTEGPYVTAPSPGHR